MHLPTRLRLTALLLATAVSAGALPAPGDNVEVREGDVWSPADYLAAEGRRHQIRYADGTEEWVTADRVREAGGEAGGDAGGDADPQPEARTPEEAAADARREAERDARRRVQELRRARDVEFKDNSRWKAATIKQFSDPLFLVATNDNFGEKEFFWKWVGAERLRLPGEAVEGPDTFSQFEESVGSGGIRAVLAKRGGTTPRTSRRCRRRRNRNAPTRPGGAAPASTRSPPLRWSTRPAGPIAARCSPARSPPPPRPATPPRGSTPRPTRPPTRAAATWGSRPRAAASSRRWRSSTCVAAPGWSCSSTTRRGWMRGSRRSGSTWRRADRRACCSSTRPRCRCPSAPTGRGCSPCPTASTPAPATASTCGRGRPPVTRPSTSSASSRSPRTPAARATSKTRCSWTTRPPCSSAAAGR